MKNIHSKHVLLIAIVICAISLLLMSCQTSDTEINDLSTGRSGDVEEVDANNPQITPPNQGLTSEELESGMLKSTYACGICKPGEVCKDSKCTTLNLENKDFCGNYKCESEESFDGKAVDLLSSEKECYFDCTAPCLSENCNQYAEIHCACDEYSVLSQRHGCIGNAPACDNCGPQEQLLPEVLKIQTEVVKCLANYFEYQPPRLVYKVFYNPTLEKCNQPEGCTGIEGGIGGPDYVIFHNLDGFRAFGEVVPTKAEYLTADIHETTHYFLYHMLHGVPSWFHEAVAIQTNERLDCVSSQTPWGDAYLQENEGQKGGIFMDDGTTLNLDFYLRLKNGETQLSEEELKSSHILGTLFVIGLKQDYQCGLECIKDAVIKLHVQETESCTQGKGEKCGIKNYPQTIFLFWMGAQEDENGEEVATAYIKQAFDQVAGKDVQPLFTLLHLGEYQPAPGACGPLSCSGN